MLERRGYLEEYVNFWNSRPETNRIWVSVYTPQIGEKSPEDACSRDREILARELPPLAKKYPKLLFHDGLAKAFLRRQRIREIAFLQKCRPITPRILKLASNHVFSAGRLTVHNADAPLAAECTGSEGSKWWGLFKMDIFVSSSVKIGLLMNRLRSRPARPTRWTPRIIRPTVSPKNSSRFNPENPISGP